MITHKTEEVLVTSTLTLEARSRITSMGLTERDARSANVHELWNQLYGPLSDKIDAMESRLRRNDQLTPTAAGLLTRFRQDILAMRNYLQEEEASA